MLSVSQRIKILPVITVIRVLGFWDSLGSFPEKIFALLVVLIIPFAATQYINQNFEKDLEYLRGGIVSTYYATPTITHNNVLGAAVKREIPYKKSEINLPYISAKSFLIANKDKILHSQNSDEKLAPASTTKLMTALVALDLYEDLDEKLTVPSFCTTIEGSKAGLSEGEEAKVRELLNALLVASSADSACVLATSKISYTEFVQLMNDKAKEIKMENTHFTNPIGLDGINSSHYSTASDLLKLAKNSTKNEVIKDAVKTKETQINNLNVSNTNKLLWEIPNSIGIKTGTTAEAGEVLIYEYKDEEKDQDLVVIVMGSVDRFSDTKNLLNWTFESFAWE